MLSRFASLAPSIAIATACLAPVSPTAALAATVAYAADQNGRPTSVDHITLTIPVTATVEPVCTALNPAQTALDMHELGQVLPTVSIGLVIRCNSAFRMALVSQNGGLKSALAVPDGYANTRDYQVALHVIDDNNLEHVSSICSASTLAANAATSACATSLRGPAAGGSPGFLINAPSNDKPSYLLISDAPLPAAILASGADYADTIRISLAVAT